ncbi:MAG TPA: class I SAM-dependent methyltransferase [Polyangiaceae bacterium]|nr:class I SAM-dependent methyltransferase [Polyangiaceae bacterium]
MSSPAKKSPRSTSASSARRQPPAKSASRPSGSRPSGSAVSKKGAAEKSATKEASKTAAKAPKKAAHRSKPVVKKPKYTAKTADKHELYQLSVQAPDHEIEFVDQIFRTRFKRRPLTLREDFCGTALLCAAWVKSNAERTATGVDIDGPTLDWGRAHNLAPLGDAAKRITLLQEDVRKPRKARFDVINALNFSYWIFTTRDSLRAYFEVVRKGLGPQGMFVLDAYGGWESQQPMLEPRRIAAGFTYVWDQDQFCPISHAVTNYIHFEFKDGTKLEKAFTYEWRFWSLPEITELLREAGFGDVRVHWDVAGDDEEEHYKVLGRAENQPGWLVYVTASN